MGAEPPQISNDHGWTEPGARANRGDILQIIPNVAVGQRIGLLGGSFDPPHEGHVSISLAALRRFDLDALWWLVSPGNPLKPNPPAPLEQRLKASRALLGHPRIKVTDLETKFSTRYTAETLKMLMKKRPIAKFVWLMGADNLAQFHLWQDWQWIIENVPIGVLARPGERLSARMSKTGRIYRENRLSGRASRLLGRCDAPAWCFVNVPMSDASSTEIRSRGEWRT